MFASCIFGLGGVAWSSELKPKSASPGQASTDTTPWYGQGDGTYLAE